MTRKVTSLQTRLYLIAAIILLVGLGSSTFIYLTAGDVSNPDMIYEFEHSKRYTHDLELYGGKVNLLASEFIEWFDELWQGKSLAFTIACITIFISLGFFFTARHLPSNFQPDARDEKNRVS